MTATKEKVEAFVRHLSMKPEDRFETPYGEVFIADGFIAVPTKEFPFGYYRTTFFVGNGEDDILGGPELMFDAMHDCAQGWDMATKKRARVNRAKAEALAFLKQRERVRNGG